MKSIFLSTLFLISILGFSQPCALERGLVEIEQLRTIGEFDDALSVAAALQNCNTINETEKVKVLIAQSKVQRDNYAFGKAEVSLYNAKALLEKNRIPLDFEFKFLLAEMYAYRGNSDAYNAIILQIKDKLISVSNTNTDLLGRYYLVSFRTTNKSTELPQGINYLQRALTEFEKNDSPPIFYYGNTLRSLGNMYRTNADFDKSIFYYKKGKTFMLGHYQKNHFEIAYYDYAIGAVYYEKMEYKLALDHFLDAFEVWKKILQPESRYMRYLNEAIGDMYWELKDPEKALHYFNLSMVGEEKVNNDRSEDVISVADSLVENGNYASAINYYQEAYKWREKEFGKNSVLTGACKNFVARAIRFSGDTEGALAAYQEAIRILVPELTENSYYANPTRKMQVQSYQYLLESLLSKGELLKELYSKSNKLTDLEAALQTQEISLGMLEDLKNNQMSEASREFWTNRTLILVESSIETAVALYQITKRDEYLAKAFNFSERSKALLLLASLYDHEIDSFANVSEAIILKEKELKKSINDYVGKIESEEKRCSDMRAKVLSLWKNKLNSLQNEYDLLVANIKDQYPDYYTLKYDNQVAELATIQKGLLNEKTALISYFTGTKNTYVFYVGSTELSVRKIEDTAALFDQTHAMFTTISSLELLRSAPQLAFDEFVLSGYQLFEKLLKPEIENQEVTKLIIIPDGKLCYLPFESLLTKEVITKSRDYKSLPYLLYDYSVSFSPSATIQLLSENDTDISDNYMGFAPNYEGQKYSISNTPNTTMSLENLYFSSQEIEQAAYLFKGKSHTGYEVSEDLLKTNSTDVGILHLAMHGAIEDQHPLLSKLFFNSSEKNDGMLHVYEIYNMNIPAQLVILSACNTAAGKLVRGEGIVSLERAFQYAGSKALLSTLWTVDDAASLKLTERFLQNIKDGQPKDIALRDAKLQFLATALPEHQHPFYWSSFKLTGNTQPLVEKSIDKYLFLGFGILGVVGVLIYFQQKQRKSKLPVVTRKTAGT
jgi:CHAT domain-containing protein